MLCYRTEKAAWVHSVLPKIAMQHIHKFALRRRVGRGNFGLGPHVASKRSKHHRRHEACADVPALSTSWAQVLCQWYCLIFHTLQQSPYICTGCGGLWDLQGKHHLSLLPRSLYHSHVRSAQLFLHTAILLKACRLHIELLTYLRLRSWSDLGSLRKRLY